MVSSKNVNQAVKMYYFVNVAHYGMAANLTRSDFEGFKKYFLSNAVQETDDAMLWNNSEEEGDVSECEEDEGTDCEGGERDTVR